MRRRLGFTLIDLLVAIAIIGTLIALLLPAVHRVTESARRTQCLNHLRNLGFATHQYVAAKGHFPYYRSLLTSKIPAPNIFVVSWQVSLMPYLERLDIYSAMENRPTSLNLPFWENSVCPSDNTIVNRSGPWTSYVANTGRLDTTRPIPAPPTQAPDLSSNGVINGIFHGNAFLGPNSSHQVRVLLKDIVDGQSNTLLLSENADAQYYTHWPPAKYWSYAQPVPDFQREVDEATNCTERGTGFIYWWNTTPASGPILPPPSTPPPTAPQAAMNRAHAGDYPDFDSGITWNPYRTRAGLGTADSQNYAARPSSFHPGGVVATFAGGNAKFMSDEISYDVYCLLMTPAGSRFKNAEPVLPGDGP